MTTPRNLESDKHIYDFSIEAICRAMGQYPRSNNLLDLSSLRPFVEELRKSYGQSQKSNGHVSVRYDKEIALAYMCAYFPAYLKLAKQSIQTTLKMRNLDFKSLNTFDRIAILGSGPGPELAAISYYMSTSREPAKPLEVHLLDRNHAGWSSCTQAVVETIKSYFPNTDIAIYEHDVDFTVADFRKKIHYLPKIDLVLGQNLTNEASLSMSEFVRNVLALSERCKPDGTVLLVDQGNTSTAKFLSELEDSVPHNMSFTMQQQQLRIAWPHLDQHKELWTVLESSPGNLIPRGIIDTQRLQLQRKSLDG